MKNQKLNKVLENGIYTNRTQYNRTKKVLKMIDEGKINRGNYWGETIKLYKNVTTSKALTEWQNVSGYIYYNVFE